MKSILIQLRPSQAFGPRTKPAAEQPTPLCPGSRGQLPAVAWRVDALRSNGEGRARHALMGPLAPCGMRSRIREHLTPFTA